MKNFKLAIYFIIYLCVSLLAIADSGSHLYTSERLASNKTTCIIQDKYGFIWIGTEYGLNKFDGYRFTHYLTDINDSTSIISNDITSFLVDKKGQFWIGSEKGLMKYNYKTNDFKRYHCPDGNTPRIETILEMSNGDILIATAGYGLYKISKGTDKIIKDNSFWKSHNDDYKSRIFEDDMGNIWQNSHLPIITRIILNKEKVPVQFKDFKLSHGPAISFIKNGAKSFYIVCMYGILEYRYKDGTIHDAGFDMSELNRTVSIRKAILDSNGNILIGTSGKGMMIIPRNSRKLISYKDKNSTFDLSTANVNNMYEDKDKNIWISCYKKGIYMISQKKDAFNSWTFSQHNYLLGSSVSSIAPGHNGDIFVTIQKTGVYKFDKNGNITSHPTSPAGANTIYKDKQGNYWLCSETTLYSYNPYTGEYHQKAKYDGWGLNYITDDGKGTLYICNYSKGLCVYNTQNCSTIQFSMRDKDKGKGVLCNDWIKTLYIDRDGLLWIGTTNGISVMDTKSFNFNVIKDKRFKNIQCLSVNETADGKILLGTNTGLYVYNKKKHTLYTFPNSPKQLQNNFIYSIVFDHNNDIWMSTAMGIWQYNHKQKTFISHIRGNGLATKEYIGGAAAHFSDDRIVFGIDDGITVFYPKDIKNTKMELGQIYLTNFILDGKEMSCFSDKFVVPYDENTFSLEFSLLNFKYTDEITFQYKINDNENWISIPEGTNAISFNKLKPGKYEIEVRATANGAVSKSIKKVTIKVLSPWYASTLAWIIYIMVIATGIYLYARNYKRRKNEELEETKMRFLINATHDIRSPLTLILGPLNKLKSRLTDAESQNDIKTIDRNAQRLLLLVNQILDIRKIDKKQMHLHCEKTEMATYINDVCARFRYNADQHNIIFNFEHEAGSCYAWIDKINFDKIISNLLSNAFKFTPDGGSITIRLKEDEQHITIDVLDTGMGFKNKNTDKLFERFYQEANSRGISLEGTGIGLNLSRTLTEMHGGTIKAANRTDNVQGAQITISIPKGNSHLKPEEIISPEDDNSNSMLSKKPTYTNCRMMVVDDDAEMRQYIKNEMSEWYKVDTFPNGVEALDALLKEHYDIVVSDIMMPEMDGVTLLKKIKTNSRINDIPVILLTSKSDVADRLESFKKGADAFLAKPFNMSELHILTDNLISNVRRLRGKYSGAQEQKDKIEQIEVKGNNDQLMNRIMKSINEHISDPDFNVESLAEDVGISRAQLHRKMKEITGISTGEFIRNLRLEQAARLIREQKINVTQVAYAVGFNNQTHFSTVFRKRYGMSPTEYAKKEHNENTEQKQES
ncbi:MAG: response regulator [Xylanibacter rarus]